VPLAYEEELAATAQALVAPGKSILASDESPETLAARFAAFCSSEEESLDDDHVRREGEHLAYRRALYSSPDLGKYVSGVLLAEASLFDRASVEALEASAIIVGARADRRTASLPGARDGETWTLGADTLLERAANYRFAGARFAKRRSRFRLAEGAPSALAVKENCLTMARAARTLQEVGLVPVLEPAILHDGDHAIDRAAELAERLYVEVFRALAENGVNLECLLLNPSMTLPGADNADAVSAELVAAYSVRTLERTVPSAVPGCAFASNGLPEEDATLCLDAINRIERKGPWSLLGGFSRSMQMSALQSWCAGDPAERRDHLGAEGLGGRKKPPKFYADTQSFLVARAQANAAANLGQYAPGSAPSIDQTPQLKGWTTYS